MLRLSVDEFPSQVDVNIANISAHASSLDLYSILVYVAYIPAWWIGIIVEHLWLQTLGA